MRTIIKQTDLLKWIAAHKRLLMLAALLLLALSVALYAFHAGDNAPPPEQEPPEREAPVPIPEPESEPEPEPVLNPLTHMPVADEAALERRAVIVSIDNHKPARPQAGISTADIMYEVPAEGGISRLLALFFVDAPELIGPVRSARPYMVDIAREWQGLFVHCGGSADALRYLAKGEVNWLNEMSSSKYFWRDKKRSMPHNLFTASENIYSFLEYKGWKTVETPRALRFYSEEEGPPLDAAKADILHINYPDRGNKNSYIYDPESFLYARSIGDDPHIDINTEGQVQAANILVQQIKSKVLDSEGRLEINLVGEGGAMLFTRGTVQEGNWMRASLDSPTYFRGEDGLEWCLAPGQTWIHLCDGTTKVLYEDSTAEEEEDDEQL
ncbi:MAG: DUF3048 domain-containing protein [Clostridiales bacterium]|nr:DUF3048 domain-containing protein [Clostridiales bacterium]